MRRFGSAPVRVVLLHGAGGNEDSLAPLAEALAQHGIGAVTVSLPGRCDVPDQPVTSVADASAWVAGLIERDLEPPVVLLGHSMGGAVALETAITRPSVVAGLVLVATGARLRVRPEILATVRQAAAEGRALGDLERAILRPDTPEDLVEHVVRAVSRTPPAAVVADWEATDAFDRLHDLGRIHAPALVVGGDADELTPPKYARWLADHLDGARLVMLPEAGHWLPVERVGEVAAEVVAFLRQRNLAG